VYKKYHIDNKVPITKETTNKVKPRQNRKAKANEKDMRQNKTKIKRNILQLLFEKRVNRLILPVIWTSFCFSSVIFFFYSPLVK
jgi:hypothetical protein